VHYSDSVIFAIMTQSFFATATQSFFRFRRAFFIFVHTLQCLAIFATARSFFRFLSAIFDISSARYSDSVILL
jgi:hypothetical protein